MLMRGIFRLAVFVSLSLLTVSYLQRYLVIRKFKNRVPDHKLGSQVSLPIDQQIANSMKFSTWCKKYQLLNCSFTQYVDKHEIKHLLPKIAPGLQFAKEYAYVSSADEITEDLVAGLPYRYFMKATHKSRSMAMVTVKGSKVNCMNSKLCKKTDGQYNGTLSAFLRKLCANFLKPERKPINPQSVYVCYAYIPAKCIFEEEFKVDESGTEVSDYKVYVAHGRLMYIYITTGRHTNRLTNYRTPGWQEINMKHVLNYLPEFGKTDLPVEPPNFLPDMLRYSSQIGKLFIHARIDFFVFGEQFRFAEIQQSSGGCTFEMDPPIVDHFYGYMLQNPDISIDAEYILRLTNQTATKPIS